MVFALARLPSQVRERLVIRGGLRAVRESAQVRRMNDQGLIKRRGLWLPAGVVAPCGLPLALGCRRLGYRRAAWTVGDRASDTVTVVASLVAGLLDPVAIAVYAGILSMPV